MVTVILREGNFITVGGNPTLTSLDGQLRAPLQTIMADSWTAEDRAAFGVYRVDVNPPLGKLWAGQIANDNGLPQPVFVDPPQPTAQDVMAERRRRLAVGFDYDFGDERGVHRIGTSDDDMIGWDEVTKISNALIALGQGSQTIAITPDLETITITALEWQQILVAAGMFRQPIWQASFVLQAMSPIPSDYADDKHWPQQETEG